MKNNRRHFLRNTSIAAFSAMMIPKVLNAQTENGETDSSAAVCDPTTEDYYGQGPFYKANAPLLSSDQFAPTAEPGKRLIVSGRVQTLDCSHFIADALIDIWHADNGGNYDNTGFHLRGKTKSNSQGFYIFETIYPGKYLNGSSYRPAHIHFKITPPGFAELTTQLYFEGDADNGTDPASSLTSGPFDASERIIPLTTDTVGKLIGSWDITVDGNGIPAGVQNVHQDKGMIYQAFPNPFSNQVEIQYGVFKEAKVSLIVFDIQGRLVADLKESKMDAEKYTAIWTPHRDLSSGSYFIVLKINDMQVHYMRIIKSE